MGSSVRKCLRAQRKHTPEPDLRARYDYKSDIVLGDEFANVVYVLINNGHGFIQTTFNAPQSCVGGTVEIYRFNGFWGLPIREQRRRWRSRLFARYCGGCAWDGIPDLITQGDDSDLNILVGLALWPGQSDRFTWSVNTGSGPVLAVDVHGQIIPRVMRYQGCAV